MKKFLIVLSVVAVVATTVFFSFRVYAQSEGAIPQSGDLCGGTSGNGQIVSIGDHTFTLKRNDGRNLIVNLTGQATIETSTGSKSSPQAGSASFSDLKIGDRVTLVGGDNRDGTFTADAVVVCSGNQENEIGQSTPPIARKENTNYEKVSGVINVVTMLLVGLIWLGIVAFLLFKKRKGLVYVLFFTIFYVYLYEVLDYTLIQFQSLLLLKHFVPNLMLRGVEAGRSVNLIPLITLRLVDVKISLLNILMMMPFGFGLPFITNFRMKKVVIAGLLLSVVIEFLQFITGFMANTTFRVADINDLVFNTIGVSIGYILFVQFVRIYRHASRNWRISANPISRYIAERPQIDT